MVLNTNVLIKNWNYKLGPDKNITL